MKVPARVHVLLARNKPYGVIIRRGPAKSVCTIGWNRAKDEFTLGQWMHGRIYEYRCDLSPDGKYLIYFALNGRWQSETKGSYTAISRAPYLKAITLYPQGDTWGGGGVFTGPRAYWLSGVCEKALRESKAIVLEPACSQKYGPYYTRLCRDGWTLTDYAENRRIEHIDVFEKPAGKDWILRKLAYSAWTITPGKSFYWEEHELVNPATGTTLPKPEWEWAELDGSRIVWASKGTLNATTLNKRGPGPESQLADFNDMKFEAIQAPY